MAWEVRYVADGEYILIVNSGTFDLKQAKDETEEAQRLCMEHDASRFILDGRNRTVLEMGPSEYYQMPDIYDRVFPEGRSYVLALVLPEGKKEDQGMRFFETLCRNRGYLVKTFGRFEDAEEWVGGSPSFGNGREHQ
ncbi:MAG: hypothetical protein GF388_04850 [Candidatus Aegiribacteria sp.]|nr:hypothetical protein [Candidatus Aegiribacteria sp.]